MFLKWVKAKEGVNLSDMQWKAGNVSFIESDTQKKMRGKHKKADLLLQKCAIVAKMDTVCGRSGCNGYIFSQKLQNNFRKCRTKLRYETNIL